MKFICAQCPKGQRREFPNPEELLAHVSQDHERFYAVTPKDRPQ